MTELAEQIFNKIRALDTQERTELVLMLYEKFGAKDTEYEAAWADEIESRIDDLDAGRSKLIPAEQVLANMRRKLEERRESSESR